MKPPEGALSLKMVLETPTTTAPSPVPVLLLILAAWGAIADSRYKRKGGKRPTKREKVLLLSCIAVVITLLVVFAVRGATEAEATAHSIGYVTTQIAILLFALWEMGRWRVRRANPLPKGPTAGVVPRAAHLCPQCGQASAPPAKFCANCGQALEGQNV